MSLALTRFSERLVTAIQDGKRPLPVKPSIAITKRRRQIWEAIEVYVAEHGCPPTLREIGTRVGLSSWSTVFSHLKALKAAGIVDWEQHIPRSIRVLVPTGLRPVSTREALLQRGLALVGEMVTAGTASERLAAWWAEANAHLFQAKEAQ